MDTLRHPPAWPGEGRSKDISLRIWAILLGLVPLVAVAERPAKSESLAEGEGEAITAAELEQAIGAPLRNLEEQIGKTREKAKGRDRCC